MNTTESKILEAIAKGYTISEMGVMYGPSGKELCIKLSGTQRYPTFSINDNGKIFGIPVHQFAAYCFYGKKPDKLVVRHLDGDTCNNSKDNLRYGTHSENNLDKPKETRVKAAKAANKAQTRHPSLKLSDSQMDEIVDKYKEFYPRRAPDGVAVALASKFGINRNTVTQIAKRYLGN